MNSYLKGAIGAVVVIAGLVTWYLVKAPTMSMNQMPAGYRLIETMERDGVPEIELERLDGTKLKLSSLRGKIVVVNFWASWCNPCVEEFPSMVKLVEEMKGEVVVLAISTDDDKKDIGVFLKAFGLPKPGFEVLWDKDKTAMKAYGVEKIPESFLVAKDGKLLRKVLGIENWANANAIAYFKSVVAGVGPDGEPTPAK